MYLSAENQVVVKDCLNWIDSNFTYPDDVTDVIIFDQCKGGQEETLQKVNIYDGFFL